MPLQDAWHAPSECQIGYEEFMKLKTASLLLLCFGWLPSIVWFMSVLYFGRNHANNYDYELMKILTILVLPGLGGFLAGWCWKWFGLLVSLMYIVSGLVATPVYFWISSLIFARFPVPVENLPEGPTGLLLIFVAGQGTVVALIGALVGVIALFVFERRVKPT
jgi:hypothetical protein